MNGYLKIRVMEGGRYADCWQQIADGVVVGHVADDGSAVTLPEVCEAHVLTGQMHFAPNVLRDPSESVEPMPLFVG